MRVIKEKVSERQELNVIKFMKLPGQGQIKKGYICP